MSFKDYLEEQRDYTGSSRSYIRKNDYINRKKKEEVPEGSTDDTDDNKNDKDVTKKETKNITTISNANSQKSRTEPEYGTTKK